GGLQAAHGYAPVEPGLRVPAGGASPRCPVSLSGALMPKILRGAVRNRSIIKIECGFSSPRASGFVSLTLVESECQEELRVCSWMAGRNCGRARGREPSALARAEEGGGRERNVFN